MIILSPVIVEFNGGDIEVGSRVSKDIGEVAFASLDGEHEIGEKLKNHDRIYPVRLIFKQIASIDVVIAALEKVKTKMIEESGDKLCQK